MFSVDLEALGHFIRKEGGMRLARKFKVVKETASGNLLLEAEEGKVPISAKTPFFLNGRKAGFVFETIGRIEKPFYLGKAQFPAEKLAGKIVEC